MNTNQKIRSISIATIDRVPEILKVLIKLKNKGHDYVSLDSIADSLDVKKKTIVHDFISLKLETNHINIYKTRDLIKKLEEISGVGLPQEYLEAILAGNMFA